MAWRKSDLISKASQLFAKIVQQKHHAHYNHEIHPLHRHLNVWLPNGINAILSGQYDPRHLTRYVFPNEVVDSVHVTDRIFQHLILKVLKPTFPYVMNSNCYHLNGPSGVKLALARIKEAMQAG